MQQQSKVSMTDEEFSKLSWDEKLAEIMKAEPAPIDPNEPEEIARRMRKASQSAAPTESEVTLRRLTPAKRF